MVKLTIKILSGPGLAAGQTRGGRRSSGHARKPNVASRTWIGSFARWGRRANTPRCAQAPVHGGRAAAPRASSLRGRNGTKRDIDPASELLEEDEEQPLPESEQDIDLAAAAGPLAVGRAVIANHAKLAPSSPGVYRMIDAKGDVLYV